MTGDVDESSAPADATLALVRECLGELYDEIEPLPYGLLVRYFRAREAGRAVTLAVPPLDLSDPAAAARFEDAAARLETISGPALADLMDSGVEGGVPFFELDAVEAERLAERLDDGPMPSIALLRVAERVIEGVEGLHRGGASHGEIHPANVVITVDDPLEPELVVLGGGFAELLRGFSDEVDPDRYGTRRAEPAYLAPEVRESSAYGPAADQYAIGVMLHHMVSGAPADASALDEPAFDDIPALPEVIRASTARTPDARYPDASAMRAALDWMEVRSSTMSPHTQDIPLWMESSVVASIPVPALHASAHPSVRPLPEGVERVPEMPSIPPPANLPGEAVVPSAGSIPPPPSEGSIPPGPASYPPGPASVPPDYSSVPPPASGSPASLGPGSIPPGPGSIPPRVSYPPGASIPPEAAFPSGDGEMAPSVTVVHVRRRFPLGLAVGLALFVMGVVLVAFHMGQSAGG